MRLGERLLAARLISDEQLQAALEAQVVHGGRLGTNLVELGGLKESDLARILGAIHGCAYSSGEMKPDPQALAHMDVRQMDQHDILPMRVDATRLTVAVLNPHDFRPLDALAFKSGKRVVPVVIPEFRMNQLLRRHANAWRPMRALDMHLVRQPTKVEEKAVQAPAAQDLMSEEEFQNVYSQALSGGGAVTELRTGEMPISTSEPELIIEAEPQPTPAPQAPQQLPFAQRGGVPPPAAMPHAAMRPVGMPTGGMPPAANAPAAAPLAAVRPGAAPPAAMPPVGMPRAAVPPAAVTPAAVARPAAPSAGVPHAGPPPSVAAPPRGAPPPSAPQQPVPSAAAPSAGVPSPGVVQTPPVPVTFAPGPYAPGPAVPVELEAPLRAAAPPTPMPPEPLPPPRPPPDLSPLTFATAQAQLAQSSDREDVARTILRFAVSKWRRALLLNVQGDLVTGWAGLGQGVQDAAVHRIGIALVGQSTFKLVRDLRSHYVGPVRTDASSTRFYKLLGDGFPTTAVLLPLLVRGKVVHLVYMDDGPGQLTTPDVGELLILALGVGRSYEAMIRKRQQGG